VLQDVAWGGGWLLETGLPSSPSLFVVLFLKHSRGGYDSLEISKNSLVSGFKSSTYPLYKLWEMPKMQRR
jgi:hypothetical protein